MRNTWHFFKNGTKYPLSIYFKEAKITPPSLEPSLLVPTQTDTHLILAAAFMHFFLFQRLCRFIWCSSAQLVCPEEEKALLLFCVILLL